MEDQTGNQAKGIVDAALKSINHGGTEKAIKNLRDFHKKKVTRIGKEYKIVLNGKKKEVIAIYFTWCAEVDDPCKSGKEILNGEEEGSKPTCCKKFKLTNNSNPIGKPEIKKCNCGRHLAKFLRKPSGQKELEIYQLLPAEFNLGNFYFIIQG